jgi:hypothetical protein
VNVRRTRRACAVETWERILPVSRSVGQQIGYSKTVVSSPEVATRSGSTGVLHVGVSLRLSRFRTASSKASTVGNASRIVLMFVGSKRSKIERILPMNGTQGHLASRVPIARSGSAQRSSRRLVPPLPDPWVPVLGYRRVNTGRSSEGVFMGDKSPKKDNAKKPAHSLKEKRAAKHEKQRENRGLGSR